VEKDDVKLENLIIEVLRKKGLIKKPCDFILKHKDYIATPQFLRDNNIKTQ
jgi:predicted SPOUT superfamily RNA methylase MTH1